MITGLICGVLSIYWCIGVVFAINKIVHYVPGTGGGHYIVIDGELNHAGPYDFTSTGQAFAVMLTMTLCWPQLIEPPRR